MFRVDPARIFDTVYRRACDAIREATTLEDALDAARREATLRRQGDDAGHAFHHFDYTEDMPVFGGAAPADTQEVWSWDRDHLLVGGCVSEWRIVRRDEW